jgi:DNA-binding transcriptional ArsR family regulator
MVSVLKKNLQVFNENKLLILQFLFNCTDITCGCDLIEELNIPKNLLSYHIKQLEELGMIEESRCGRRKQYKIKTYSKAKVKKILEAVELI